MPQLPTSKTLRRLLALLTAVTLVGVLLPTTSAPVLAERSDAGAAASGFSYFKFPNPQPLCGLGVVGFNVTANPWFERRECGFSTFGIVGADPAPVVSVEFIGPGGGEPFETQPGVLRDDGDWEFLVTPEADWPVGLISVAVLVDGSVAGTSAFGHQILRATLEADPAGAPYAPGDPVPVSGTIAQVHTPSQLLLVREGVPATFSVVVVTPAGDERPVPGGPITADPDGRFSLLIPGSLTADLAPVGAELELTIGVAVVDASYDDPESGRWAAEEAGRTSVALLASPRQLMLDASFVSSTGWVRPGETFPFRVFVTNATESAAEDVTVSVAAPPSAFFVDATPLNATESAVLAPGSVTWSIGTLPGATEAGPMVRTLVVTARAATFGEDPEVVWKDLSSRATLNYRGHDGTPIGSVTHGPKVIPPSAAFESARFGDKPFPIVPVEYVDLERQSNETWDNDSEKLDEVVNDPGFIGSTFNLYQEMSYGQLHPHGTVPSAGVATADFSSYGPGFEFTTPDLTRGTCRGATFGSVPESIGSPAYAERISDGWYQLPGTTEYYGGDWPVFTATTVSIDSACGQPGKAVFDAAQIADPEIDYNRYDSDKDGVVDFFMLVFVGCGGNGASQIAVLCEYFGNQAPFYDNIWPHSSSLEGQYQDPETGLRGYVSDDQLNSLTEVPQCWTSAARLQFDDCAADGGTGLDGLPVFVRVGPYNVNPETVFQAASVISHEYGHFLGLPDFYDASGEVYGDLNLMAADYSQHMTIFSKQELGWVVPDYLQPGDELTVSGWSEIKSDTGAIHWQTPSGTPYTLSAANGDQNVHNGQAYGLKLLGRQLIDPSSIPSGTHVWHSGRGNDFGCSPTEGHNLDLYLPELRAIPAGTPVTLEFKASWDIEWDWDYGFVLTTADGQTYTSHVSQQGFTTDNAYNPNTIACQASLNNGITGTSGAWQEGQPVVTVARAPLLSDYSHGAPFLFDSYDISDLVGAFDPVVRFSYFTDAAFDRPGWFIDDIVVRAGADVIYSSDFEADSENGRLFPGGCGPDGSKVAVVCTDGWSRVDADTENQADHAYYLELRDQSGFDFDGHGQSDRGDTSWFPGLFIEYTDENHGYGNNGTPPPPAQHYIDSNPIPGSDCVSERNGNCADISFTSVAGDNQYSDEVTAAQPGGFVNSFEDPDSHYGDGFWHFDYGCLTVEVTAMTGAGVGPATPVPGDLAADAVIKADGGCAPFDYGREGISNAAPIAVAQARPTEARAGEPVTFDGSGSYDDLTPPSDLTYQWNFGDGEADSGQTVHHAYETAGVYTATLTVTDQEGLSDTATVTVTVSAAPDLVVSDITTVQNTGSGTGGAKPKAGDRVVVRATIANRGSAAAGASETVFTVDAEPLPGSPVGTGPIPAGGSAIVELSWDTRGLQGEHRIAVSADGGAAVAEADEGNNTSTLAVIVRGNKVTNGDFSQPNPAGSGPEAWEGSSTGAGSTGYTASGGSEDSAAVTISGTGGSVALAGMPTWTSAPIAVTPGETLSLRVGVASSALSSAPGLGLAYLGPAGELLSTVRLVDLPLATQGFTTLEGLVTIPAGVVQVRVVLFGFAAGDLATAGTVTFDDVGLFSEEE